MDLYQLVLGAPGKRVLSKKTKDYNLLLSNSKELDLSLLAYCNNTLFLIKKVKDIRLVDIINSQMSTGEIAPHFLVEGIGIKYRQNDSAVLDLADLKEIKCSLFIYFQKDKQLTPIVMDSYENIVEHLRSIMGNKVKLPGNF